MKKIYAFVMLLTMGFVAAQAADCQDGPYGLQINGTKVVDAPKFGEPDAQGRVQYKAACVNLKNGDVIKLINQSCGATWMVDIDPYGEYQSFEGGKTAGQLTCKADGKYDFYIKLSMQEGDLVYIGPGECGDNPPVGPVVGGNPRYYYKGNIDGVDVEPSEATLFEHGIAEIEFSTKAALMVLYQVDGAQGVQYMTPSWIDGPRHTTLSVDGGGGYNKWNCPLGTTTLYLYDNEDGTLEISADVLPGKKLADPQPVQAIENTPVCNKARKMFIDGQLRIVRGDKMYDATGREL